METRAGIIKISYDALEEMLGIPEKCGIIKVFEQTAEYRTLNIMVKGIGPNVQEGAAVPVVGERNRAINRLGPSCY